MQSCIEYCEKRSKSAPEYSNQIFNRTLRFVKGTFRKEMKLLYVLEKVMSSSFFYK